MNDFAKPWRNHEVKSESANYYFGSETDTYLVLTLNKNDPELASPWGETLSSALVLDPFRNSLNMMSKVCWHLF